MMTMAQVAARASRPPPEPSPELAAMIVPDRDGVAQVAPFVIGQAAGRAH